MTQPPEKRLVTDARLPTLIDTPTAALLSNPASATALAIQTTVTALIAEQLPAGITAIDDGNTISFYASAPGNNGGGTQPSALLTEGGDPLVTESGDGLTT